MRFKNKYKFINTENYFINKLPSRLESFKRPKWKKVQSLILKSKIKKNFIYMKNSTPINLKRWEKLKFSYLENIKLKRSLSIFYGEKGLNYIKFKQKLFFTAFCNLFIKPFFKLPFLLKLSNFSQTFEDSFQKIIQKKVWVNGNLIKSGNLLLKKGDCIMLKNSSVDYLPTKSSLNLISVFAEIDYYTSTIIILKNYYLNDVEISLLLNEKINFYKLNNYLIKK
jgi:ribosomal protein S4